MWFNPKRGSPVSFKNIKKTFDLIDYCIVRILLIVLLLIGAFTLIAQALKGH